VNEDAARALEILDRSGILMLQDAKLPSLVSAIAGGAVRGSWWSHRESARIFHAANELDDHADVATFKLLDRKVCFVHRRLWPAIAAIGAAREQWQLDALELEARELLDRIDREGRVRASKKPAKAIELHLLAASESVHTESGAHATDLLRWDLFASARGFAMRADASEAKREIAALVSELGRAHGASPKLPWLGRAPRR
jgi:hypothetical protein